MSGTIIFLGAGATKSCGGPLTGEILPGILAASLTDDPAGSPNSIGRLRMLREFLLEEFHVAPDSPQDLYPGLPLLMSLLDTAIERRQHFNGRWDAQTISILREEIEFGIFDLLEERLKTFPTNSHWSLLNSICGTTAEPSIISTNYDLIIDTAIMAFSRNRFPQGKFPNYGCDISTESYCSEDPHFGSLLKLHGSLNWLHCKTCQRLEIGASDNQKLNKYLPAILTQTTPKELGLKESFMPDGSPCPVCGTKLRPLLVAPTHLKNYRNPHLAQVWYQTEQVLRDADRAVFIGYSLPDDDVEVIYLLKRGLAHLSSDKITVVGHDTSRRPLSVHPTGQRYRALWGDGIDWRPEGMDAWLSTQSTN